MGSPVWSPFRGSLEVLWEDSVAPSPVFQLLPFFFDLRRASARRCWFRVLFSRRIHARPVHRWYQWRAVQSCSAESRCQPLNGEEQGISAVMCVCVYACSRKISRGLGEVDVVRAKGHRRLGTIRVRCTSGCPGSPGEGFSFLNV